MDDIQSIVFNEDCMVGMARYPDKYFDLCITSPPYNLGDNHHTGNYRFCPYNDNMPEEEYQESQINFLNELWRICKDDCSLFYNHKNRIKNGRQITPYEWILDTKWILKEELVWFNGSQNFDKCRFYPMTERVYWLSKGLKTKFLNNINHHDFFNWQAEGTDGEHKRTFPKEMVRDLLSCFDSGLKIIDPYLGSGTTRLVSYSMGFDFTGFEIDKDYYEAQEKRFQTYKAQLTLF